jgi:hypothetical protein
MFSSVYFAPPSPRPQTFRTAALANQGIVIPFLGGQDDLHSLFPHFLEDRVFTLLQQPAHVGVGSGVGLALQNDGV